MPVPDFSPGEVLTAAAMDSIGLWLVKTQAVAAGGSSVTVTGAFSSTYENYRIVFNNLGGSNGNSGFMTLNGSAGATYNWAGRFTGYGLPAGDGLGANTTSGLWLGITGPSFSGVVDIQRPNLATPTTHQFQTSAEQYTTSGGGRDANAASSTAFTISVVAGTLTAGNIRVYGYRN
jgi:hypothetical protein